MLVRLIINFWLHIYSVFPFAHNNCNTGLAYKTYIYPKDFHSALYMGHCYIYIKIFD